jgi:hypothetical protein
MATRKAGEYGAYLLLLTVVDSMSLLFLMSSNFYDGRGEEQKLQIGTIILLCMLVEQEQPNLQKPALLPVLFQLSCSSCLVDTRIVVMN